MNVRPGLQSSEMTGEILTASVVKKLITIDLDYYRENNKDLVDYSDEHLLEHYGHDGYREGRMAHPQSIRENFFDIEEGLKCLEIGPFFKPLMTGENVKYIDILSESELLARAKSLSVSQEDILNIPNIDFVSKDGSLKAVTEKFDVLISAHNLEHQVDLIGHLIEAYDILVDGGKYKMVVPNCAFCFDASLSPSRISEIILANRSKPQTHSIAKVIEHLALTTHNDSRVHWAERRLIKKYEPINVVKVSSAIAEFDRAKLAGKHLDVHSWQFLPHTLSDILQSLIELKIINFQKVICYGQVMNRNEFCIELIK